MDESELEPRRKKPQPRDLTPIAIAELEEYIVELQGEIERVRGEIERKRRQRTGADALFKR